MWRIYVKSPHARGRPSLYIRHLSKNADSSPLTRGRLAKQYLYKDTMRFIPSCEGQTASSSSSSLAFSIHPLMRGADPIPAAALFLSHDSSPHARGRLENEAFYGCENRFIPSCEGQTAKPALFRPLPTIHPLMRGADPQCLCGFQPP